MRNQLVVIYWRDIPAQVNAQAGRQRHQVVLDERFQLAIDRAAMVAGKQTAHEYVAEWRRQSTPCGADLEAAAHAEADRLHQAYPADRLSRIVDAGGVDQGGTVDAGGVDQEGTVDAGGVDHESTDDAGGVDQEGTDDAGGVDQEGR